MPNLPNTLTLMRLIAVPFVVVLAYADSLVLMIAALVLFLLAMATDVFDGYIARTTQKVTPFGALADSLADKMLILSVFFVFVDREIIPMWMVLVILFRELLVTGLRQIGAVQGKVISANWTGKIKATLQVGMITIIFIIMIVQKAGTTLAYAPEAVYLLMLLLIIYTLISGFFYVYWNRKLVFKNA